MRRPVWARWANRDLWPDLARRVLVCPWRGHVPVTKFSGAVLCRRCGYGIGHR